MPPLVGAPERGPSRKLLQLEFKIRSNFGASKDASWGPVHARIMEIGRVPVECERAARGVSGGGAGRRPVAPTVKFDMWPSLDFFHRVWTFRDLWTCHSF